MNKKVKILFIHHATGWGGAPNSMISLIKNLDQQRFDVKVLLIKHSMVADKLKENNINYAVAKSKFYKKHYKYFTHSEAGYIKWYQVYKFFKLSLFWLLSRFYFAKRELAKHDYDIVHLNSSVLTDWLAPAKQRGKVIIHIREPFRKGRFDILRPVFRSQMRKHADHIIAISKDNAKRVNLPEKTTVIYNYAEVPGKAPSKNSYSSKKVLYLGGSQSIKGYYTMVDALDYLDKDVLIYFGGYYSSSAKSHSIKGRVKQILNYNGNKKQKNAIEKIANHPNVALIGMTYNVEDYLSTVCCLVSPFEKSHFSRPIIEAYMHKKPVIGSDVEGMEEVIINGETGFVIPKNNPKLLAQTINRIVKDDKLAKRLGEAGYQIAIKSFTSRNIKMFESVYNQFA